MKNKWKLLRSYSIMCLLLCFATNVAWALDEQTLEIAIWTGDRAKLQSLITNNPEIKGDVGAKVLHRAAMSGQYEAVELLVAHGASINYREPLNGYSTLHQAVSYTPNKSRSPNGETFPIDISIPQNKLKIAELLIAHGADVNAKSKGGMTPLHNVGTKELAKLLIKNGANIKALTYANDTPLYFAAANGHREEVIEALVAHGADVNSMNDSGVTPLHIAVSQNHIKTVEILIKHGAKLDLKNRNGETPLSIAVKNNNTELATLLTANGSGLNDKPVNGISELHWAIANGNILLAKQLLLSGAKINAVGNGFTPIEHAVMVNRNEIVELLIAHGADANATSQDGTPLLHRTRNMEMLELLLNHGADANAKDARGDSLLWKVCYDDELSEILLKHGADINIRNSYGRTALHLAAGFERDNAAKWLLAHGADANAKDDNYGQTPLFHAVQSYERDESTPTAYISEVGDSKLTDPRRFGSNTRSPQVPPLMEAAKGSNNAPPVDFGTFNSIATIQVLLRHKADVKATDSLGQTSLHVAPTKDIAQILITYGVDVNAKRNDGATALHLAAVYGRTAVVKELLDHGADVNVKAVGDITPLHYAKGFGIVKLLLARNAGVDARDEGGNTPLYMADEVIVANLLLTRGAALNTRNSFGETPLMRMIRTYISNLPAHGLMSGPLGDPIVIEHGGNIEVVQALLDHGADVNLDDRDLNMPLFYVREAINNPEYVEVISELKSVESLLIAHGAKLEKREEYKSTQSSKDVSELLRISKTEQSNQ
jgi:ankyrin repeat protein